jgi:hypothetical protein
MPALALTCFSAEPSDTGEHVDKVGASVVHASLALIAVRYLQSML